MSDGGRINLLDDMAKIIPGISKVNRLAKI
jgi:hypothetical protein